MKSDLQVGQRVTWFKQKCGPLSPVVKISGVIRNMTASKVTIEIELGHGVKARRTVEYDSVEIEKESHPLEAG